MENLPVEVVGNILSRLEDARDVVMASGTCKNWRQAFRSHLRRLSFSSKAWPLYRTFGYGDLQELISQTIFQTTGLQDLTLMMDDYSSEVFSAAPVTSWLIHTRRTLRRLSYDVRTITNVDVLTYCGRQNLETLLLAHCPVALTDRGARFPCLKSLFLHHVRTTASDIKALLSACPKIETLELVRPNFEPFGERVLELTCPTVKSIYIEGIILDSLILEADSIECLHVKDSVPHRLEVRGKGTLKHFKLYSVGVFHLHIAEAAENLETVDVRRSVGNFTYPWPAFLHMISKAHKLRKLRVWEMVLDGMVGLESLAVGFPQLTRLSLSHDPRDGFTDLSLQGTTQLESVTVLELGWTSLNDSFRIWVEGVLERCPNVKKLIIYGAVSTISFPQDRQLLEAFTGDMVQLIRKYIHVKIQFKYE